MKRVKLLGAVALGCAVLGGAGVASATPNDAAAPYITKPGVRTHYSGTLALFTAHVFCGDWKGVAQLQVGTAGVPVLHRTKYICERARSTDVTFAVSAGQLPVRGKYEYTFKVGRHDRDGNVTRWTHA